MKIFASLPVWCFFGFLLAAELPASAQDSFADVSGIRAFLAENFHDKNDAMVIGVVDEQGSRTFGGGKLDNGTTNQVDGNSVFFIGSISKTFTALLLQDMADRGEVKLDDQVSKYLPQSVKMPSHGGKQIRLIDLATHTAGFPHDPNNMSGKDVREQFETYTVDAMYAYLSQFKLNRDPGTEFEYSNLGMSLLGHVMARKAGTNFESLLVSRICRPLQMDSTRIIPTLDMKSRLAMGHDEQGRPSPPFNLQVYAPAGAVHSTANDLLKYLSAQLGLIDSELTPAMQKTHVIRIKDTNPNRPGRPNKDYGRIGMAWMTGSDPEPEGMDHREHAGGAGSYHAWLGFDKKQRRGVVVLTTSERYYVEQIGGLVLRRKPLRENTFENTREPVGIGAELKFDEKTHIVRILNIIPNSPASAAGLSPGLLIAKIDGIPTATKTIAECVKLIRGPAGTKVQLELINPQLNQTNTVELKRGKFLVKK